VKNPTLRLLGALLLAGLSGCASIAPSASAPAPDWKARPDDKMAIVNFVRLRSAATDDVEVDLWDGTHFIGSIPPGALIQYEVEAGQHQLMGSAGNWSHASGELQAGKHYFIKANVAPGALKSTLFLGIAKADDKRIPLWLGQSRRVAPAATQPAQGDSPKRAAALEVLTAVQAGQAKGVVPIRPEDGLDSLPAPQSGK
jgi:hypothetical protein